MKSLVQLVADIPRKIRETGMYIALAGALLYGTMQSCAPLTQAQKTTLLGTSLSIIGSINTPGNSNPEGERAKEILQTSGAVVYNLGQMQERLEIARAGRSEVNVNPQPQQNYVQKEEQSQNYTPVGLFMYKGWTDRNGDGATNKDELADLNESIYDLNNLNGLWFSFYGGNERVYNKKNLDFKIYSLADGKIIKQEYKKCISSEIQNFRCEGAYFPESGKYRAVLNGGKNRTFSLDFDVIQNQNNLEKNSNVSNNTTKSRDVVLEKCLFDDCYSFSRNFLAKPNELNFFVSDVKYPTEEYVPVKIASETDLTGLEMDENYFKKLRKEAKKNGDNSLTFDITDEYVGFHLYEINVRGINYIVLSEVFDKSNERRLPFALIPKIDGTKISFPNESFTEEHGYAIQATIKCDERGGIYQPILKGDVSSNNVVEENKSEKELLSEFEKMMLNPDILSNPTIQQEEIIVKGIKKRIAEGWYDAEGQEVMDKYLKELSNLPPDGLFIYKKWIDFDKNGIANKNEYVDLNAPVFDVRGIDSLWFSFFDRGKRCNGKPLEFIIYDMDGGTILEQFSSDCDDPPKINNFFYLNSAIPKSGKYKIVLYTENTQTFSIDFEIIK